MTNNKDFSLGRSWEVMARIIGRFRLMAVSSAKPTLLGLLELWTGTISHHLPIKRMYAPPTRILK
jgi:hypothetical protein